MRILITGATGFLGAALTQRFALCGHDILALGRDRRKLAALAGSNVTAMQVDLAQPDQTSLAGLGKIDAVVHSAALSAPWGRYQNFADANITGTVTALNIAAKSGARRFINIASPTVYFAMRDQENVEETAPLPPPVNAYAATKAQAEKMVLSRSDLGPISLRPRGIYGNGDTTLLPRLLQSAQQGPLPMLRYGQAAIDLTHVSDVVGAVEAALTADALAEGEAINISSGEQIAIREIVEAVARRAAVTVRWRSVPLPVMHGMARALELKSQMFPSTGEPRVTRYAVGLFAYRQSLNIDKAQRLLGWRPQVDFAHGLDLTFKGAAK